jgi:hypothetical protein
MATAEYGKGDTGPKRRSTPDDVHSPKAQAHLLEGPVEDLIARLAKASTRSRLDSLRVGEEPLVSGPVRSDLVAEPN